MVVSERMQHPLMASSVQGASLSLESMITGREEKEGSSPQLQVSHVELGLGERACSAASAAFVSAIIVNPLDVAKVKFSLLIFLIDLFVFINGIEA